jgi:hypothetical protein
MAAGRSRIAGELQRKVRQADHRKNSMRERGVSVIVGTQPRHVSNRAALRTALRLVYGDSGVFERIER